MQVTLYAQSQWPTISIRVKAPLPFRQDQSGGILCGQSTSDNVYFSGPPKPLTVEVARHLDKEGDQYTPESPFDKEIYLDALKVERPDLFDGETAESAKQAVNGQLRKRRHIPTISENDARSRTTTRQHQNNPERREKLRAMASQPKSPSARANMSAAKRKRDREKPNPQTFQVYSKLELLWAAGEFDNGWNVNASDILNRFEELIGYQPGDDTKKRKSRRANTRIKIQRWAKDNHPDTEELQARVIQQYAFMFGNTDSPIGARLESLYRALLHLQNLCMYIASRITAEQHNLYKDYIESLFNTEDTDAALNKIFNYLWAVGQRPAPERAEILGQLRAFHQLDSSYSERMQGLVDGALGILNSLNTSEAKIPVEWPEVAESLNILSDYTEKSMRGTIRP